MFSHISVIKSNLEYYIKNKDITVYKKQPTV